MIKLISVFLQQAAAEDKADEKEDETEKEEKSAE